MIVYHHESVVVMFKDQDAILKAKVTMRAYIIKT